MIFESPTALSDLDLATQLERDIQHRGLRPGARYLSTRQAANRFGASLAAVDQAMQVLAERGVVERRQRSGTYVAPQAATPAPPIQSIYVLSSAGRAGYATFPVEQLLDSLYRSNPDGSVQFAFLPPAGEVDYVRRLLKPAVRANLVAGVLAVSCPRDVYAELSLMQLPVVVLGSLDQDLAPLISIDMDHWESGRLLADHLIEAGHRRLALFSVGSGRPGDFRFHEGVVDAMTDAGFAPNALVTRLLPADHSLFATQAKAVLAAEDRPTGVICRGERMLDAVVDAMESLGLTTPGDVEIVVEAFATARLAHSRFGHIQTQLPFQGVADRIGLLLKRQKEGKAAERGGVVLPVEFRPPGTAK